MAKRYKFLTLILIVSALLVLSMYPNIPNAKAQTQSSIYIYTSVGGTIQADGTNLTGGSTYSYPAGSTVNFTAIPNAGCKFLYWEYASSAGPNATTDNTLVYTVPSVESAVQAMFIPNVNTTVTSSSSQTGAAPFEVPISIGGTTTPAAGTYTNYTIGTVVDFTATPQNGFTFMYWLVPASQGDAVSIVTDNTLAFNVTANACALQAFFAPTSSNITLPAISTVNEFSTATTLIIVAVLVLVAFGTYAYRKKTK